MEVQASVGLLMDHKVIAREFPPTLVGHKWGDPKNTPPLKISPNKQLLGSKDSDTLQCLLWTVEWIGPLAGAMLVPVLLGKLACYPGNIRSDYGAFTLCTTDLNHTQWETNEEPMFVAL